MVIESNMVEVVYVVATNIGNCSNFAYIEGMELASRCGTLKAGIRQQLQMINGSCCSNVWLE